MWMISFSFGNDVRYLIDVKTWLATQFRMKILREAQYVHTYINKILVRYLMHSSKKDLLSFRHEVHLCKEQFP